jgi:hypothetical protein
MRAVQQHAYSGARPHQDMPVKVPCTPDSTLPRRPAHREQHAKGTLQRTGQKLLTVQARGCRLPHPGSAGDDVVACQIAAQQQQQTATIIQECHAHQPICWGQTSTLAGHWLPHNHGSLHQYHTRASLATCAAWLNHQQWNKSSQENQVQTECRPAKHRASPHQTTAAVATAGSHLLAIAHSQPLSWTQAHTCVSRQPRTCPTPPNRTLVGTAQSRQHIKPDMQGHMPLHPGTAHNQARHPTPSCRCSKHTPCA